MYEYKVNVVRVIDGDTIVVDIDLGFEMWLRNQSVRLFGINTPEVRTRDEVAKKVGIFVKGEVERLVSESNNELTVTTVFDKNDKFGRILGVFKTKTNLVLNDYLLNERYAVKYDDDKDKMLNEQTKNINWLIESGKVT